MKLIVVIVALLALMQCGAEARRVIKLPVMSDAQPRIEETAVRRQTVADAALGNAGVNASLSVSGSLFEKVFDQLIPLIDEIGNNVTVPADSGDHWSFDTFTLEDFALGNLTVQFTSPSNVVIGLENLQLTVPHTHFDVWVWIIFKISCSGRFWGSVSGTNIYLTLDFTTMADGSLSIASVTPNVQFGSLSVNHDFPNFFCKVGQDIIQLFIGNINNKIQNAIENDLPGLLSNGVLNALTKALSKLAIRFSSQPAVVNDTLTLDVALLPPFNEIVGKRFAFKGRRNPLSADRQLVGPSARCPGPFGYIFLDRDVTIAMTTESVNDLLQDIAAGNRLEFNKTLPGNSINTSILEWFFPGAYHACPGCPFSVDLDVLPQYPPTMSFHRNTMLLTLSNAILGLNAVNTSSNVYDPLFDVYVNMSLALSNVYVNGIDSRLYFHIALNDFAFALDHSILPGIDVAKLGALLDDLLNNVLVPIFNMDFTGIPLNLSKDGFALEKLRLRAEESTLAIGADVQIPPL